MSGSTTQISELPDTGFVSQQQPIPQPQPQSQGDSTQHISNEFYGNITGQPQGGGDSNYQPINVHPNPYGTPQVAPEGLPMPESSPQRTQTAPALQQNYTVDNMPQQRLPSRDIPMNTLEYQQDATIQANHVPKVKLTSDYIREYELANEEQLQMHRGKKYRQETAHDMISDLQTPILIGVLYFAFQMPIVNTLLRKYLSFANIYHEDGNFNFMGLVMKSAIFGSLYYSIHTVSTKISEI